MKFSTVIPLYNKQSAVRRALYSVLNQSCENNQQHEIIIVDDGSTDDSLTIVKAIKKEHPYRNIHIHSQVNAGVSAARNKGIELAQNEYITFLDADDSYESNFYSEINELALRFPFANMFATGYRFVNTIKGTKKKAKLVGLAGDDHQVLDDFFYSAAHGDLPITSSSVCIKKRALKSVGGFPVGENMGEDQAVWSQLALTHLIAISPAVCANYFEEPSESLMQTESAREELPYSARLQAQLDNYEVPEKYRASVECYISGHLFDLVRRNNESGNSSKARLLMTDERTKAHLKRWGYWYVRVLMNKHLRAR